MGVTRARARRGSEPDATVAGWNDDRDAGSLRVRRPDGTAPVRVAARRQPPSCTPARNPVDGELLTVFVPSVGGVASPAGSQYEEAYDCENAIEYILKEIRGAAGEDALTKIDEFEPIIEEINEGETVE